MTREGDIIGNKYRIGKRLATGGQSRVFLASTAGKACWAVKEIRSDGSFDEALARKSLETEIDVLKRLEHPGLVKIVDAVVENGSVYMVSEYVRGMTLEEIIRRNGPMSEAQAVDIGIQLCDVLGYLHSRQPAVIYRDLKPSNIMMRRDGRIALIDFGTARMGRFTKTPDDTPLGTRGYAAPEQYLGSNALCDATDVYTLGKTLTALLSGGKPGVRPRRLKGVSRALRSVLTRCTRANANRRYESAADVYVALRRLGESRMRLRVSALLRLSAFAACATAALWQIWMYFGNGTETFVPAVVLAAICPVLWCLLDIPGVFPELTAGSVRLAAGRAKQSARVNGVFRIGRHMPTKEVISWQDIEIPLDDASLDVRLAMDDTKVNYVAMKGFRIERDVMVTMRENYFVV